jgi:hypothetical protein
MNNDTANCGATRLDALLKKQAALQEAIRAARLQQEKLNKRETERASRELGAALIQVALHNNNFRDVLREALEGSALDARSRAFLQQKGIL